MILVTGGTGVMGSVLVRALASRGERLRVLTLRGDPFVSRLDGCDVDVRYGDIAQADDLEGLCDGVSTVYHLAAVIIAFDERLFETINVRGTANLIAQARRSGVRHFIYVSSASVVYPRPTAYSLSKRKCEELVAASGLRSTIVRPTLVYDRKGGQEFDEFLGYLKRFPVVPFIGPGTALKRPVYVNDIMGGLLALCNNPGAYGKTYNFSGGEAISLRDFARLCLRLMNMEGKPIVHLPVGLCLTIAKVMGVCMKRPPLRWQVIAGMTQDADLDPGEAMRDLGYRPAKVSEKLAECFPRDQG